MALLQFLCSVEVVLVSMGTSMNYCVIQLHYEQMMELPLLPVLSPDPESKLVISVAASHQRSRKLREIYAVPQNIVKRQLDSVFEIVD